MRHRYLLIGLCLLNLAGCTRHDNQQRRAPTVELPPQIENGWAVWRAPDPALIYMDHGALRLLLQCASTLQLQLRDIEPAQSFPQPDLVMTVAGDDWADKPAAEMIGRQTALNANFSPDQDTAKARRFLAAVRAGAAIRLRFREGEYPYAPIPAKIGAEFSDACDREWGLAAAR